MNERIEELALECYQAPEFDYKKFAELIVKECIAVHEDDYGVDIIGDEETFRS